ncbi:MAG: NAD(P)-dependent oxidoreductase, partial [Fimbriimonadaceae bacterium]|nr:NAD(P)-dependent oxidoreductase [Fimbriimonadaceae bacterium]
LREAGHWVISMDRFAKTRPNYNEFDCDLRQPGEVMDALLELRPDAVIHLAANPSPFGKPRHLTFTENVGMCWTVFQTAADLGIMTLAYASSEQANGWSSARTCPERFPVDEASATPPQSAYALSKLVGEQVADSIAAQYPALSIASLRINYVMDPDHHEKIPQWAAQWPGSHANFWAYVDARDAAHAFRLAVEKPIPGHRVYMVAADDLMLERPTRDAIRDQFGEHIRVDERVREFGSTIDCGRIERDLGWRPKYSWRSVSPATRVE